MHEMFLGVQYLQVTEISSGNQTWFAEKQIPSSSMMFDGSPRLKTSIFRFFQSDSPWPVFPQFAKQFSAFDEFETRRTRFLDDLG